MQIFKKWQFKKSIHFNESIAGYEWLCMDIGTENMKARYVNTGLRFDEPSYIAEDYEKNRIYFGEEAKSLVDKTNENIIIKRPVRDGNIADPRALEKILMRIFDYFKISKATKKRLIVIMATPSDINPVQRQALESIVTKLGAYRGFVQEEVKMAALGAGQDIFGTSIMSVDIGGGSADIAVISKDSILHSLSSHCAGDYLTEQIREYILRTKNVHVGLKDAEDLKKAIASLVPGPNERPYRISGLLIPKDSSKSGEVLSVSKTVSITPEEIREVMQHEFREHIIPSIRKVLRLSVSKALGSIGDLKKLGKGITISGGGAYIKGIDKFIQEELAKEYHFETYDEMGNVVSEEVYEGDEFEVRCSEDPLYDVINGCVKYRDEIYREILEEKKFNVILSNSKRNTQRLKR
ncbi:MAG: rod shape-determining protein [Spiroplasma sp.]|nr:rod shape-determining protein [Spiroplasma sp.]